MAQVKSLGSDQDRDPIQKAFSFRIGDTLHSWISNHIRILSQLSGERHGKSKWVESAVREKLDREKTLSPAQLGSQKSLGFKLDRKLAQEVEHRVSLLKKLRPTYSFKQWIIEAIHERLEQERQQVQVWIDEHRPTEANELE